MYNALRLGKKVFTVGVVVTTIAWSIGLAMFLVPLTANAAAPVAGDLIKGSLPGVYYYGADGKRYVFPNEKTYKTWYSDFSLVKTLTDAELAAIALGGNATYKPGVKMVKITTDPKVYAVGKNGALRWVKTEAVATDLYGSAWNTMIEDVPDAFFVNYTISSDIAAAADFDKTAVTAASPDIGTDKGIGAAATVTATGGLTVALASDTPAAATIVCDTAIADGAQIMIPMAKYTFTASSAGAVKVTTLKLKRGGIAADTDFNAITLWDGDTKLAEYQSFSKTYVTFSSASGLFEVAAGTSKTVTLKVDLSNSTTAGTGLCAAKTYNLGIEAAADVTSNAAGTVAGTFPITGNSMTGAGVSDLGILGLTCSALSTCGTYPSTIDPGVTKQELWRLSLSATNQDMELRYLKLDVVGTVTASDLANIYLEVSGVQVGTTQQLSSDKTVTFDLRSSPLVLTAGQTKNLLVKGDVISGSTRSFKFTIQKRENVEARDKNYNILVKLAYNTSTVGDSFAVAQPSATLNTSINSGRLVMSVSSDSPTGNIADYGTNLTLAKFGFQAIGEDIKIAELNWGCVDGAAAFTIINTKLLLDGVQVGTTDATEACTAAVGAGAALTFGNTFIIPSGTTKYLTAVADTTDASVTTDETVYFYFATGAEGDAIGRVSLTNLTPTAQSGRTLTVKSGGVSVAKNQAFSDRSSTQPSGVTNEANVKIGSFTITAGSGEAVDVTSIVLYDGVEAMGSTWQNLKLKHDATQIGTTIGSLHSTAATYTFTPSPAIRIAAGGQYQVDVYADIMSGAGVGDVANVIEVDQVVATGVNTSSDASSTNATDGSGTILQAGYVASTGRLGVVADPDTPIAQQVVMGSTEQTLAKFKLSASSTEAINITQLVVNASSTLITGATGTWKNIKLYDGATLLGTVPGFDVTYASSSNIHGMGPAAVFSGLSLEVPKGGNKILTLKADITSYDDGGSSGAKYKFLMATDYSAATASNQNAITCTGKSSGSTLTAWVSGVQIGTTTTNPAAAGQVMTVYRTKLSVAWASDTPSGVSSPNSAQTIAKFVVSNSANVGDYTATVNLINFTMSQSGASCSGAGTNRSLYVYKDSVLSANQLATTDFCNQIASVTDAFGTRATTLAEGDFTDLDIAAGASKTIWVTGDTTDNSSGTVTETLSVAVGASDMTWSDGVSTSITVIDTLPLLSKTFTY